jgi:hypothetical protein
VIFSFGCVGVAYKKTIAEGFILTAFDTDDEMEIQVIDPNTNYAFVVVPPAVSAVGLDSNFIIAKQHSGVSEASSNKQITNYYIVPLHEKPTSYESYPKLGPLSEEEFFKRKNELHIKSDFSLTLKSVE